MIHYNIIIVLLLNFRSIARIKKMIKEFPGIK